VRVHVGG